MTENIQTVCHVIVLGLITFLCHLTILCTSPIQIICWILCRLIGREFKLEIKLRANLIKEDFNQK